MPACTYATVSKPVLKLENSSVCYVSLIWDSHQGNKKILILLDSIKWICPTSPGS